MVSKVAVIALVVIVACPILLGYAMNLEEVTVTEYKPNGDSVNVSQLLADGATYSYVNADSYRLNTNFFKMAYNSDHSSSEPVYESFTTTETSLKMRYIYYAAGTHPVFGGSGGVPMTSWSHMYYQSNNGTSGGYITLYYRDNNGNLINTYNRLHSVYWDSKTSELSLTTYLSAGSLSLVSTNITVPNHSYKIGLTDTGGYIADGFLEENNPNSTTTFVDLSAGFHNIDDKNYVELPENTKSYLMTINLDSVTADNYSLYIANDMATHILTKTTTAGVVKWVDDRGSGLLVDLYYDPDRSDNTYQIYDEYEVLYENNGYRYYETKSELRYVGGWPATFGAANAYITYDRTIPGSDPVSIPDTGLNYVNVRVLSSDGDTRTLTTRMDAALFRGYQYSTINNKTYNPADFKTNPSTTISNINIYGEALMFGGNTYNVKDGNITLGTHQIPIRNMVFDSVPVAGGYENRINGTAISTTLTPSTITFSGTWSANISTVSMDSVSVTQTEWQAGSFGWDGMDHNFLIVGLLTSLGAFIALGIYMRRTKASLWPLLIVCGGAAALFFAML